MTGLDQRQDVLGDAEGRRRNPYLALIRTPGTMAFSATAFVGRMSMSMYGLGTVLLIASLTGRYGVAGTVAAAGGIGYAAFGPWTAQLADRIGQHRVLLTQVMIFAVTASAFITCAELRAPFPVLLVTGVLAGASLPSTSSMVRSRWSAMLSARPRQLHAAFALESVNDELIFVIGPALVTVLATQVFAAAGVGLASVLAFSGTLMFALQHGTEPPARPRPPRVRRQRLTWRQRLPTLPAPGLVMLGPALLVLGAMFGSIDLSTVARATELGHRPLAGLILGTYALGSAIGGLWYGSRQWRAPVGHRFIITGAIAVGCAATFWAVPNLIALDLVCLVSGLAIAPTLIAGYAILERQAEPHRRTEALAWLGSTASIGVALGSAATGHILDAYGARAGYGFAACCGAVAVAICLAGRRKLATAGEEPAPALAMP
ncbi:MAG TPA: MFS transporter [Streptosporangiaceae bacterium]|nr:MFS transporter [Streptosporangiaceae bacterium]